MKNLSTPVWILLACCLLAQSAAAGPDKTVEPVPGSIAAPASPTAPGLAVGAIDTGLDADAAGLREMPPGDAASYSAVMAGRIAADAVEQAAQAGPMDAEAAARFRAEVLDKGSAADPAAALAPFRARAEADPGARLFDNAAKSKDDGSFAAGFSLAAKRFLYQDRRTLKSGDLAGLEEMLGRAGWDRRVKIVEQMKTRFPKDSVAGLIEVAKSDEDLRVRQAAMQALGELKAGEALAPLLQIAQHGSDDDSGAASKALGALGDVAAQPALLAAFQGSTSETPRFTGAAEGLLRLGHDAGLEAIGGRMESELSSSIQSGGWKRQPATGYVLDRYHDAGDNDALVPALTRAFAYVKAEQPRLVLRKAVKLIDGGGHQTVDWSDVAFTLFLGYLFGWTALVLLVIWSLMSGSFFKKAKGAENLEPAAAEVLD